MTNGVKNHRGFIKKFPDETFLNSLSSEPQTTKQIRIKIGCSHDTASKTLKRLAEQSVVNMLEIEAGSRTGRMYLWTIKKQGENDGK